jgi:hypothetical protein
MKTYLKTIFSFEHAIQNDGLILLITLVAIFAGLFFNK